MENLLSVIEAAQLLGISRHTLNCWVSKRRVPFVKLGRRVLFNTTDLVAYIQANKHEPRLPGEGK